jgi:hypothetical protein
MVDILNNAPEDDVEFLWDISGIADVFSLEVELGFKEVIKILSFFVLQM